MKRNFISSKILVFAVLASVALSTIYPLIYILFTSSRTREDYLTNPYGIPGEFTLSNFRLLVSNYSLDTAIKNTLLVVCSSLTISLMISSVAGFALAKYSFPLAKYVNYVFVAIMLIPGQILIIPIYLLLSKVQLVGHLQGLAFVYIATNIPFGVFFLRATFKAVPDSIIEAAIIDGAGFFRQFFFVAVPNAIAGVTTLALLQFIGMWNELLYAYLLLPDQTQRLLTPALASIGGRFIDNKPLVAAALCITAAPIVILLTLSSRFLVRGVSAGIGNT